MGGRIVVLRVLALVPYPTGSVPGQRYRIEQWAPLLRGLDIEVTFSPFLSSRGMDILYRRGEAAAKVAETLRGYRCRLADSFRRADHDVTYVYREQAPLAPEGVERFLARNRRVVLDFDDAIYLRTASRANAWAAPFKSRRKTAALCRVAREVMVGNETLAAFARQHARSVTIVPSTIDATRYTLAARPANPRPIVGWTGSLTTVEHLRPLFPALRRLRESVDFELRIIGGGAVEAPGLDVSCVPWQEPTEVEDLRPFDVGLMPLPDDDWSRGKCGMKALQYMALGIPPVVSPVGFNETLVQHEVSGLHARQDQDWVDGLFRLLRDPDLRARMGAVARRVVMERYTAEAQVARVAEVFRRAGGAGTGLP